MLDPARMFVLVITVTPFVLKKLPPEELVVKVTLVVPTVVGLPYGSCRCTVIVPDATPAVLVTAVVVNTSLLAAAGLTTIVVVFVAGVRAPSVYFNLMLSARLSAKVLNVTTPLTAATLVVPCRGPVPLASAAVTVLLSFVATLPN